MEFSFDKPQNNTTNSDTSNIANERLRKAIERNRQRQKEREQKLDAKPEGSQESVTREPLNAPRFPPPPPPASHFEQPELKAEANEAQTEFFHSSEAEPEEAIVRPTRRSVARPEDTEFVTIKRAPKKPAALNYHTTSHRKKSKSLDPKIVAFLIKATWIFAAFLVLRLLFARGGVTDFYSQHRLLEKKQNELVEVKNENMELVREIERMHSDTGYQKKLVRDNLGFIAADEFLVLFPKD